jgi:hypothetical protein
MKKILVLYLVVMMFTFIAFAAELRPGGIITKPPIVIDPEVAIIQRIAIIQTEKAELSNAEYSGTMAEVLAARVADVNAICVKAKTIIDDANTVLMQKGIVSLKRETIVGILTKDAIKMEEQKSNAEFLGDLTEVLDPNNLDPKDPNYIYDLEVYTSLSKWCLEVIKPI